MQIARKFKHFYLVTRAGRPRVKRRLGSLFSFPQSLHDFATNETWPRAQDIIYIKKRHVQN